MDDEDLKFEILAWFCACLAALIVLALYTTSCTSIPKDYTRGPLSEQILRPLPGYTGLVNTECRHDPKTGVCVYNRTEYDLKDRATRQRLRDAHFICNVGGLAYRIALNEPALIYETYDRTCFLGICGARRARVIDEISIDRYQDLIDSNTECLSAVTFEWYDGEGQ